VPPISPVVSVSRKSQWDGSATASQSVGTNRRSAEAFTIPLGAAWPIGSENHLRTVRCSPNSLADAAASSNCARRSAPSGRAGVNPREPSALARDRPLAFLAGLSAAKDANLSGTVISREPFLRRRACSKSLARPLWFSRIYRWLGRRTRGIHFRTRNLL